MLGTSPAAARCPLPPDHMRNVSLSVQAERDEPRVLWMATGAKRGARGERCELSARRHAGQHASTPTLTQHTRADDVDAELRPGQLAAGGSSGGGTSNSGGGGGGTSSGR